VVGEVARDDLVAIRLADRAEILLGELPGGLHRFAAAGREENSVEVSGSQLGELRRQLDRRGVGVCPKWEEMQILHLLVAGFGQLGSPVPNVRQE
jgi:hypothetical protein